MKIKVGVIFGGETVEHEVSIISAVQAMRNINKDKYDVIPIYISKERIWYSGLMLRDIEVFKDFDNLKKYANKVVLYKSNSEFYLKKVTGLFKTNIETLDIILPIVHGNNVEDGSLAGYLDTVGIPYVGSSVLGSALGQDKVVIKQILKNENIPVVDYT
ncbi:MAG: D-alanine--D-alanine ligase, partial [Tenericutes bacterium]|nr:D-alanine--D-alanine ligase [Mycoplasmatota bacterium]